ncbi:MAG: hypothetical protein M1837_002333 [Sclerophora amabilis]|nr:MAG: hypothetical protein M1837_002333 [Sclerophora amabilis]
MSSVGAPLSSFAPCPATGSKKEERKRSLIRVSSSAAETSTKKNSLLRHSKSVGYQKPGLPSMRFGSAGSRASKEARKRSSGQDQPDGTILRAVPQAGSLPLQSPQTKSWSRFTDSMRSPARAKSVSVPQEMWIGSAYQSESPVMLSRGHGTHQSRGSLQSDPEYLGVWKDGTVHWAQAKARPATADGRTAPKDADRLDGTSLVEVPVKLENRPPRPKIHLTIPEAQQSSSLVYTPRNAVDNPSSHPRGREFSLDSSRQAGHHRNNSNNTTTTLFVAPSGSNGNTERRPATMATSGSTTQDAGLDQRGMPVEWSASSRSASSEEAIEDDAVSCYSNLSSRSSVESSDVFVAKRPVSNRGSLAFSIASPAAAGVFDEKLTPLPRIPSVSKSQYSLADLSNKPLPPEPTEMAPAPLFIAGRSSSSMSRSHNSATPTSPTSAALGKGSPHVQIPSGVGSHNPIKHSMNSLTSKRSTTELDAIDKAFKRSSPPDSRGPTLSEAEAALEKQLSTISEKASFNWDAVADMNDPLQIARGPMDMAPSRAPPPRPSGNAAKAAKPSSLERESCAPSLSHGANQVKPSNSVPRRRGNSSNSTSIWAPKAKKILGRPLSPSGSESPATGGSPDLSRPITPGISDGDTPAAPGTPDPAVVEVHKRLEVLKMKGSLESFKLAKPEFSSFAAEFQLPIQGASPDPRNTELTGEQPPTNPPQQQDESNLAVRRGRRNGDLAPSRVSLAVSDVPQLYADMPASAKTEEREHAEEEVERTISADAAESVLFKIMHCLDNLRDLFATAVVSKGFYKTFKRNELPLIKNSLRGMCPSAWELREMSPPYVCADEADDERAAPGYSPTSYLRYFTRDMYIMVALKSLILVRCESFLRPETVSALAGNDDERSLQLDAAFWRVWTFSKIFGSRKCREDDIVGQMDWLRGGVIANQETCTSSLATTDPSFGSTSALLNPPESFAMGNAGGLSPGELWDMMEIWTCLGTLVEGFFGKCDLAREYGIFDNLNIAEGDVEKEGAMLEEWVFYILSLGPSVIIDLATPSDQPGPYGFALAAENGWTDWDPPVEGGSRSTFLKEAIIRVYEEQVVAERRTRSPALSPGLASSSLSASPSSSPNTEGAKSSARERMAMHAAEIRARRQNPQFALQPASDERPMSDWQTALHKFRSSSPVAAADATLMPSPLSKQPMLKQVDDPVDTAVWKMQGMGFPPEMAKKALAETDTGENLNVPGAINLCLRWTGGAPPNRGTQVAWETSATHNPHNEMPLYA